MDSDKNYHLGLRILIVDSNDGLRYTEYGLQQIVDVGKRAGSTARM